MHPDSILRWLILLLTLAAGWAPQATLLVPLLGAGGMIAALLVAHQQARRLFPTGHGGYFLYLAAVQRGRLLLLATLGGLCVGHLAALGWQLTSGGNFTLEPWCFGVSALAAFALGLAGLLYSAQEPHEADAAVLAVLLGVGLWLLLPLAVRPVAIGVPLVAFLLFVRYLKKPLAALKWTLLGLGQQRARQFVPAFTAYRRALAAVPGYAAAQEGFWQLHRELNLEELPHQPELLRMLDYHHCLDRAKGLLLERSPAATRLDDAKKLLALVKQQQPELRFQVVYWQAVAAVHAGDLEEAARLLRDLLTDAQHAPADLPLRLPILAQAWHLVLLGHGGLKEKVGLPLLAQGQRLNAIAAIEQTLATAPTDEFAVALKPLLYADVTLTEYEKEAGTDPLQAAKFFDHAAAYAQGKPLLETEQWRRGVELWRIAARGKPEKAPSLYRYLASVVGQRGDGSLAEQLLRETRRAGQALGTEALTAEARADYFAAVKELADAALARGDDPAALELLQLYATSDQSGADTLRQIAGLHEKRGDLLAALVTNERCLVYDAKYPLHVQRRDQYYISLQPAELKREWERLKSAFDLAYCSAKARSLLDHPGGGAEQVDWALHLLQLVAAIEPEGLSTRVLLGRAHLRRGEKHLAQPLLEAAYAQGQKEAPSGEAEEDWQMAARLLGDLYLEAGFPEKAIPCLLTFRKNSKSGTATILRLGQAYEQIGDTKQAKKCYENVVYYQNNLAEEARQGLARLAAAG